jgi:hypothetical protein
VLVLLRCSALALVIPGLATSGETYAVGETMEAFSLEDQHGEQRTLDANVELILFSRDMDGGDFIKQALKDVPGGFLAERHAIYVADISGMPKLVAKLFALRKMRKRPYAMWLDREGDVTQRLPDEEGRATLISLEGLRVVNVVHLDSAEAVARAVGVAKALPD